MTETTSAEAVQRELGGCPVKHLDASRGEGGWRLLAARA